MYQTSEEIKQFVREHVKGTSNIDLAVMANEKFGTRYNEMSMASLKNRLGVKSGIDAKFQKGVHSNSRHEFKKGHIPINKGTKGMFPNSGGATRFKKGHRPATWKPVGSERCNVDGYWEVKVAEPKKWKLKHVLIWEAKNGPVPKGHMIVFLNGDKNNLDLENLAIISRAVNARRNQRHLHGDTTEIGKVAIATAELIQKVHDVKKSERSKQ